MTEPAPLVYAKRSTCESHLPPLNQQPMTADVLEKVLRAGQGVACPDCGRKWSVVQEIVWGSPVTVKWQAMRPASMPDPVEVRLAALEAAVTALTARVVTLEGRTVTTHAGRVAVPALAVAAKVDLTVTWQTPFPDTSYSVEASLSPALVGRATAVFKSKSATSATYTVTAGLLVSVGSDLLVTASRYA